MEGVITIIIFLVGLITFMLLGMPIAFGLMITNIILMIFLDLPFAGIIQRMFNGINNFALLAVPLFVFAGLIMGKGSITERLVKLSNAMVGWITGSLGHVNILASMFNGGMTGSAVADSSTMGSLLIPAMEKDGYPTEYAAAITASSSVIGIVIPPSIPFVLYGVSTGVSISKLFLGGIIPGIIIGISLMLVNYFISKLKGYGHITKLKITEFLKAIKRASLTLLLPLIIVGGILFGVFTPTEAGAIASAYALFLVLTIYKDLKIREVSKIFVETAKITGVVIFLASVSSVSAWILTLSGVPEALSNLILSITTTRIQAMLIINVFLLLIGMILDLTPAMLIFAPIFAKVAENVGLDPIHFGVIMSVNLGIGLITPPIGTVLYVVTGLTKKPIEKIIKANIPLLITLVLDLLLFIAIPSLITFIPSLIGK